MRRDASGFTKMGFFFLGKRFLQAKTHRIIHSVFWPGAPVVVFKRFFFSLLIKTSTNTFHLTQTVLIDFLFLFTWGNLTSVQ